MRETVYHKQIPMLLQKDYPLSELNYSGGGRGALVVHLTRHST
jgi:hypothetical protein